jgi:signal-transduction protein with cAMP-binding, CBS, and nucleotidyltransferase domain
MTTLFVPDSLPIRLNDIQKMPPELWEFIKKNLHRRQFRKWDFILTEGEVCRNVYFLEKGVIRIFIMGNDEEKTIWVLKEDDIFISVISFFDQVPAADNIQCLENTVVFYISFEVMEEACKRWPEFEKIKERLKSDYYVKKEKRDQWIEATTKEERYKYMMEHERELARRMRAEELWSYLKMGKRTFYKLRRKWGEF